MALLKNLRGKELVKEEHSSIFQGIRQNFPPSESVLRCTVLFITNFLNGTEICSTLLQFSLRNPQNLGIPMRSSPDPFPPAPI